MPTLGITPYEPAVDINFGRTMTAGLEQLGAQLREDMTAVMANRQVKNLGSALSQIDPKSDQFQTQVIQAAMQNPLGAMHPAGQMAITTLGAAHKAWEQEQLVDKRITAQANQPSYGGFGGGGIVNRKTGEVVREPTPRREPAPRAGAVNPALKSYETEKSRLDAAVLKTETALQQSAGGYDVNKLATATKTYRVNEDGKQADDGEFVVLELPDGKKEKVPWKDFTKMHGNFTALQTLKAQRDALKPPVEEAAPAAAATDKVRMLNPDGRSGFVPKSYVEQALKSGYKLVP